LGVLALQADHPAPWIAGVVTGSVVGGLGIAGKLFDVRIGRR
jgi:hypothetical protein